MIGRKETKGVLGGNAAIGHLEIVEDLFERHRHMPPHPDYYVSPPTNRSKFFGASGGFMEAVTKGAATNDLRS